MNRGRVLTIAGSAARGGAGIQADLKTFQELDVYGVAAITAIVARHPQTKRGVYPQPIETIEAQAYTMFEDIGADVIKTGMLFTEEIIRTTASILRSSDVQTIVTDPVMIGKLGSKLLEDEAILAFKEEILPQATIITPNMYEAAFLMGKPFDALQTEDDLIEAAQTIHTLGSEYVLVKGGRLAGPAIDILYDGTNMYRLTAPRIHTKNTNGAGCTYSAAIAAQLAKGATVPDAVFLAKRYITAAIRHAIEAKRGVGPTDHAAFKKFGEDGVQIEKIGSFSSVKVTNPSP